MESLNLNGRVVGKTKDGMILVALTISEYLESLPGVPAMICVEPREQAPAAPPAAAKATPRSGHRKADREPKRARRMPASETPAAEPVAGIPARVCIGCGEDYQPRRKDQKTCGKPACKRANASRHAKAAMKEARRRGRKPRQENGLTPEQKQARLDAIRAAARRVNARHEADGSSLHVDEAGAADAAASGRIGAGE